MRSWQSNFPSAETMMQCQCGFDCADFIRQHAIPVHAQLACPGCDALITTQWGGEEAREGAVAGLAPAPPATLSPSDPPVA